MARNSPLSGKITRLNLKDSIRRVKDTQTFEIEKAGRFSSRILGIIMCLVMIYLVSVLINDRTIIVLSADAFKLLYFLSCVGPLAAGWNILVYSGSLFSKFWTSRRIIVLETLIDLVFTLLWFITFTYAASNASSNCGCAVTRSCDDPAKLTPCDRTNWLVVFAFGITSSWVVNLTLDIQAIYKNMISKEDVDPETLLEIHRTARMGRM